MKKFLIIFCIFLGSCKPDYIGVDAYIKTINNKEYSCKKCDIYVEESFIWMRDDILLDMYSTKSQIRVRKSEISEFKINIYHNSSE